MLYWPQPMRMFPFFLAVLMAVVASTPADDANLSGGEGRQRALEEFERVDAELSKLVDKQLQQEERPALREALLAAHRAFLRYREADSHFQSVDVEGGSDRTYYVNKRMTYLTRQRIQQLTVSFLEGWPSLPSPKK